MWDHVGFLIFVTQLQHIGITRYIKDVDWVLYAKCLWTKSPFHALTISRDTNSQYPILWQFQISKSGKNESSPHLLTFPYMS